MSASILLRFIPSTEANIWFESSADKSVNHALPGITRNMSIFYFAVESYILKFRIISNFWKYVRMRLVAKKKKKKSRIIISKEFSGWFYSSGVIFYNTSGRELQKLVFRLFLLLLKCLCQTTQKEFESIKSLIFLFCFDVSKDLN